MYWTDLILWDAVEAHRGDGHEHDSDGQQTEEFTGNRVTRVLQSEPQTLPDVSITHFLEMQHVSEENTRTVRWQYYC